MNIKLLAVMLLFVACSSNAQTGNEIFQKDGAAIGGYDPVAFITEQKPVKGSAELTLSWKSAQWHFVSQANLDNFKADPEKYAPQYGGYCAYGMADGHKAPTQVDTWTVVDGKLYFNYNQKVKGMWNKDRPKYIEQANKNWETEKFSK